MTLVKIKANEFGLTDETASQIERQFSPMLKKMTELESEFNEVVNLPIEDPDTSKKAKEVRLKYVKIRTGTAEIHKKQKQFYLNGGRYVDGWKNAQLFASQGKEEKLKEIENYAENLEKERIAKIVKEREDAISPFVDDVTVLNISGMTDDVFNAYLSAKKKDYEDRLEAEKQAEKERLRIEAVEKKHHERTMKALPFRAFWVGDLTKEMSDKEFNTFLSKAIAAKEKHEKEQEKIRAENERLKEQNRKREEAEKARKQKEEMERREKQAELDRVKAELEAERKRKEAEELSMKKVEEARLKAEAEAKKAPDIDKIKMAISSLSIPELSLVSKDMEDVYAEIKDKFNSFKKWAIQKTT